MSSNEPKDGFDLIEYPCEYMFKAMCRANFNMAEQLKQRALKHVSADAILEVRINQSRTAKFESVSMKIRLQSRAELEAVYQGIATCEHVIMTL